ncbi:glycosyltransferase [Mesobacillus jeotgali]|uniref:glycosyltransferase n=1 Tax=Mesobacillus jeotgali TaxID=129985 RepID=UPI001CFC8962|nr:glycosyltransferase [Mesobacillus jeotgali]
MKKKLLFVNGHLNVGGVENSLVNVLKNIDYSLYEVDLLLLEGTGDYLEEIPNDINILFYDLSSAYGPFFQCLFNKIRTKDWFGIAIRLVLLFESIFRVNVLPLAKPLFILQKKYHCAIAYRVGICTDIVAYLVNSEKKITWWHHGEFNLSDRETKRWVRTLRKFDRLIAVSDGVRGMLIKKIKGIGNKIVSIPNIINTKEIRMKAMERTALEFASNEHLTLLSIGRLAPEKGMINCVYACKRLIEEGHNVKWFLIGEGPEREEIEKFIKQFGLENNILLLGAISNPYPYIKNADIYVHPSRVESLSITILEALALNTPVTVAKSLGPMEFIRNNENGLLVEPDPNGLYKGIKSLIKDQNLHSRLKSDNSDVLDNYSPEVIMEKIYRVLEAG